MKKFIAAVMSLAMVVSATVVLASNSSPTYGGGSKGTTTVHQVVTPGTVVATATPAPEATAAVATIAPAETVNPIIIIKEGATPMPVTDGTIKVVEVGEDDGDYSDPTDKLADLNNSGYTEYGTYEITTDSDEYKEILKEAGNRISVTIDADLYGDVPFIALVNYGDEWVEVPTSDVVVNGDGTVTLLVDGLGEVKFVVDTKATPVPTEAPVVPTTTPGQATASPAEPTAAPAQIAEAAAADAANVPDKPSKEADYTVNKKVDYTVVSPQTGYLESWDVDCNVPAALK